MYRYAYTCVHADMHTQTPTHAGTHEQQEYTHACTRTQRHTQILARLMHTPQGAGSTGSSRTIHTSATKEMNGLRSVIFQPAGSITGLIRDLEDKNRLGQEHSEEARVVYSNLF